MVVWEIIFWISVLLIVHTYFIFPLLLNFLTRKRDLSFLDTYRKDKNLPFVSIVMAVYNERNVIERKIKSVLETDYPTEK